MATEFVRLLLRRASASQWAGLNPTLLSGEAAVETDVARLRVGDGAQPFNSLRAFLSVPAAAISAAQTLLNASTQVAQRAAIGITADVNDVNDLDLVAAVGWTLITAPTVADQQASLGLGSMAFLEGPNLTTGFKFSVASDGTRNGGIYEPNPTSCNMRRIVNGGAFTLDAPTSGGDYTMVLRVENDANAGAITMSGFTKVEGSFTTTDGDVFFVYITKLYGDTHANIVRMQ